MKGRLDLFQCTGSCQGRGSCDQHSAQRSGAHIQPARHAPRGRQVVAQPAGWAAGQAGQAEGSSSSQPAAPTCPSSCLKKVSSALSRCAARRCTVRLVVRGEKDREGSSCGDGREAFELACALAQQHGHTPSSAGWGHVRERLPVLLHTLRASSAAFLIKSLRAL